jgi:hypothetical protein
MTKYIIMAAFFTLVTSITHAQISDAEAEAIANLLGVQKKEAIARLVSVSNKDSIAFWKLYDTYQKENMSLSRERIKLYEQTAESYGNMTPTVADSLSRRYFNNRVSHEKSLQDYYQKIKTAINAVVAFEFYQAEIYLLTQIRSTIMQRIPTYGEIQLDIKRRQ